MNTRYLECHQIDKIFPPRVSQGAPHVVVRDFDLAVAEGEFVTLIGHSGCGKSTVLSMVAGLTPKSGGYMILGDYEINDAGPDRGVVFQAPSLLPWLSALENVLIGADQVYPEASPAQRAGNRHRILSGTCRARRGAGQIAGGTLARNAAARGDRAGLCHFAQGAAPG